MESSDKIFLAMILGALIIGVGIYFGLKKPEVAVAPVAEKMQKQNTPEIKPVKSQTEISDAENNNFTVCGASENTIVTKVIDGDTVVVEGGYHVRLLGMDADEKGYPCYLPAKTRLETLVSGKNVVLEKDKTDLDIYGRCLRYIFIGNENIDAQLVMEGLAVARFYEPDVKYKDEISAAEQLAITNKSGCKWSGKPQTEN